MDCEESMRMPVYDHLLNVLAKEINLLNKSSKIAARIQTCSTLVYDCGTYEVYTTNAPRKTVDVEKLREKLKNEVNSKSFYSSQR